MSCRPFKKKMKNLPLRFLFLLILLLPAYQLPAQNESKGKNHLGISVGTSLNQIRDEHASPLRYRGYSPSFQARYSLKKSNSKHVFTFNYNRGRLQSSIRHYATVTYFSASYQYITRLRKFSRYKWGIFMGGKWDFQSSVRNYQYSSRSFPEQFRNHFTSINFVLSGYCRAIRRVTIETTAGFPLLTYMIHSGYASEQPEKLIIKSHSSISDYLLSGTFTSLRQYRGFFCNTRVIMEISSSFSMAMESYFFYVHYTEPRLLKIAVNRFLTSFIWSF